MAGPMIEMPAHGRPADPYEPVREHSRRLYERHREDLGHDCPACGAAPGQECDGTRVATYEGMHFARHGEG
jgi:hypothetical protein